MIVSKLLKLTDRGLYCEQGGFYIDPWEPVDRAIVTHAHGDHLYPGSNHYLTVTQGLGLVRARLPPDTQVATADYGESLSINGVQVSFHPAGHILGSAQIRLEKQGEVCVVSGDYKLEPDSTCAPFEPLRCHAFVTESTFGLPIYRWPATSATLDEINAWWRANRAAGKTSVILAYSLGEAQRVLAGVDRSIGPIYTHGAVERMNAAYRAAGVQLPFTQYVGDVVPGAPWAGSLVVAPPLAQGSPWLRRFGSTATAFVSGWMQIRGTRRRRAVDRGFVLSDHADWSGLQAAIAATEAERVFVTHGYADAMARWLREQGREAFALQTRFEGERDGADDAPPETSEP